MPIQIPTAHTAPVNYPESNYEIAKYLDITKFISLLQRKSFFFCRQDKLEDQFEGELPPLNDSEYKKYYLEAKERGLFKFEITEEILGQKLIDHRNHFKNQKALTCVNCWNKYEVESAALWKIYTGFDKGIMLRTTVNNLVSAFETTHEKIQLSEVVYIDFENETIPDYNTNYAKYHKHISYQYESELRLFHEVDHIGWEHNWSKEEIENGIFIPVDLSILINEIVISPQSPIWYRTMIEDLCQKYDLNKPVRLSKLAIRQ